MGWRLAAVISLGCAFSTSISSAQGTLANVVTNEIQILEASGIVEVSPSGAATWVRTTDGQVVHPLDRIRTGRDARVALRWSDASVARFGASTELEILPPDAAASEAGLHLIRGLFSFFHRDNPGRIRILTRGANAAIEGTEFVLEVEGEGGGEQSRLYVMDGQVRFTNELGGLVLTNGEAALAQVGQKPVRAPGFVAQNVMQWCFYYPAVLDLADLPLTSQEQANLKDSLAAYVSGDLQAALAKFPADNASASAAVNVYHAALLLAVGESAKAEDILSALPNSGNAVPSQRLAVALKLLIAAVKRETIETGVAPELATELLARSYYEQSRALPDISLRKALAVARKSVAASPKFGFGWERVAELEFSFGHAGAAMDALQKSLDLAPRNAQALALKGFILASQNRTGPAISSFNDALAADSSLGNAWLGRGLCRIRSNDIAGGREDLLVAAAIEPQRTELRSYLAKAYALSGDSTRATKELSLAINADPNDPTAFLYRALLEDSYNRINEGIRDLEQSEQLNDNRSVYRSQLLLDEDSAVRSANLAVLYQDDGMFDLSLREASRAVSSDYANYSAHLFLAESYDALRDPNGINLRYETPAVTEYLLANLLAPVSAVPMSSITSRQQYSPLFERDKFGVDSDTEFLSRGAWKEEGAQYGTFQDFSYDIEAFYRSDPGQRPNNDVQQRYLSGAFKEQVTPNDTIYLDIQENETESGDLTEYYYQTNANTGLRVTEKQNPYILAGYHHEWSPGVDTLVLVGRLEDRYSVTNAGAGAAIVVGMFPRSIPPEFDSIQIFSSQEAATLAPTIYAGEVQQIWSQPRHLTVVGGRYLWGEFNLQDTQTSQDLLAGAFANPPLLTDQSSAADFQRFGLYAYHSWQIADPFQLIGGLSYDWMRSPEDIDSPPFSTRERVTDQVSPKAGFVWLPDRQTVIRAAYTRSLAGASLDQSFRIEPTEVAGINQAFRSIIPDSVSGANSGARFETFGFSLEHKFTTATYLALGGNLLYSHVGRSFGVFEQDNEPGGPEFPYDSELNERLDYRERSLVASADQLLGNQWEIGAHYSLTEARLSDVFPGVTNNGSIDNAFLAKPVTSLLHQLSLHANWNHPCGLFASAEGDWYSQDNRGYQIPEPPSDFWQFNFMSGYRFHRRKAELAVGVLNLTDRNYNLEPLTLYNEMARTRTLVARFQLNF